jgi:hypothetical protein
MSSNKLPHFQKSATRLPRVALGVVAQTKRAKSADRPGCHKCHNFLPRAGDSSAITKRSQVAPELYFSSLFLVVALRADRTKAITIGNSSRHDSLRGRVPVVALVAESQSGANSHLAHSDSTSTEIRPELAASPVAVKSKDFRKIGAILSAQGEGDRDADQRDLRRPGRRGSARPRVLTGRPSRAVAPPPE